MKVLWTMALPDLRIEYITFHMVVLLKTNLAYMEILIKF